MLTSDEGAASAVISLADSSALTGHGDLLLMMLKAVPNQVT